jgi:hypothetical protein
MTAVLKMNIQDLNTKFVEDLKQQFGQSDGNTGTRANYSTFEHEFGRFLGHH